MDENQESFLKVKVLSIYSSIGFQFFTLDILVHICAAKSRGGGFLFLQAKQNPVTVRSHLIVNKYNKECSNNRNKKNINIKNMQSIKEADRFLNPFTGQ